MGAFAYCLFCGYALLIVAGILLQQIYREKLKALLQREAAQCQRGETANLAISEARRTRALAEDAVDAMAAWTTCTLPQAPASDAFREHLFKVAFERPEQLVPTLHNLPTYAFCSNPASTVNPQQVMPLLPESPIPLASFQYFEQQPADTLRDRVRLLRNLGHIPHDLLSGEDVSRLRKAEAMRLLLRYDPESSAGCAAA